MTLSSLARASWADTSSVKGFTDGPSVLRLASKIIPPSMLDTSRIVGISGSDPAYQKGVCHSRSIQGSSESHTIADRCWPLYLSVIANKESGDDIQSLRPFALLNGNHKAPQKNVNGLGLGNISSVK